MRRESTKLGWQCGLSQIAISLHVRLNPVTRGIVKPADLARMKRDALFLNTSRAELVEYGALEAGLAHGHPGFAAVDVYESEPVLGANHPLAQTPLRPAQPAPGLCGAGELRVVLWDGI